MVRSQSDLEAGREARALLDAVRRAGHAYASGALTLRLAEDFGFCQGVEQAVSRALAAAEAFAGAAPGPEAGRLWMTGEIIHNPSINERLRQAGIGLLPPPGSADRLGAVRRGDTVIVPAFGIEIDEERRLRAIGCALVDTTCGWVRRVWRAAREFSDNGLTLVIHGKHEHEETRATASRATGPWIVLRDRAAAERMATCVRRPSGGWPGCGGAAASPGFDPTRHLERLGLVNQTTMLSAETEEIAKILRAALTDRFGEAPGPDRFRALDTFCPATQRRQEAVRRLLAEHPLDLLIVVGGFRSSNTAHLARIGEQAVTTYHVEDADCLIDRETIRHLPPGATAPALARHWFPAGATRIGVTAGASTPDEETGRILLRLVALHEGPRGAR